MFKIKDAKWATHAHLFPNGVLLVAFERKDIGAEWWRMYKKEEHGIEVSKHGENLTKIMFYRSYNMELPNLLKSLKHLDCWRNNSSEAVNNKGMTLQTVVGTLRQGFQVQWHRIDGFLGSDVEAVWDRPQEIPTGNESRWSDMPVKHD